MDPDRTCPLCKGAMEIPAVGPDRSIGRCARCGDAFALDEEPILEPAPAKRVQWSASGRAFEIRVAPRRALGSILWGMLPLGVAATTLFVPGWNGPAGTWEMPWLLLVCAVPFAALGLYVMGAGLLGRVRLRGAEDGTGSVESGAGVFGRRRAVAWDDVEAVVESIDPDTIHRRSMTRRVSIRFRDETVVRFGEVLLDDVSRRFVVDRLRRCLGERMARRR